MRVPKTTFVALVSLSMLVVGGQLVLAAASQGDDLLSSETQGAQTESVTQICVVHRPTGLKVCVPP